MALRRAIPSDWTLLGNVIGRAFAEDPVSRWTLGSAAGVQTTFTALARHVYGPRGLCLLAGEEGGTMWLPPGGSKALGLLPELALVARLIVEGGPAVVGRALAVEKTMHQRRPKFPHFYLFTLGVLPEARGRGLGRALVNETLKVADAQGMPCYLENSNPRNTSLYLGLGFTPLETFSPAPGCPVLTTMVRQPAG
jgi:ribosomal protein S18 acetylase RimI-like enzyme